MGKPFAEEIEQLEQTHAWACETSVEALSESIVCLFEKPLVAVGSGGSLTTATIASTLYRRTAKYVSLPATPLSMYAMRESLRDASVFMATAGGSNPDVIGALQTAAKHEAHKVLAVCCKEGTKLAREGAKYPSVAVHEFAVPSGSDGFLATNSLWASSVILVRAFAKIHGVDPRIPKRLSTLVGKRRWNSFVDAIASESSKLWNRETTVVLYGPSSYPAAVDLESKFAEAALSNVWIADYRHFAHGRHHWLAKRGNTSSIIAFIEPSERQLAERTLAEIPSDIPKLQIRLPGNSRSLLHALAHVFPITKSAGTARHIDPGRPGVPSFGRKIYHLNAFGRMSSTNSKIDELESVAIQRKAASSLAYLTESKRLRRWRKSYENFVERITGVRFRGVVFDYDGTLCDATERFSGIRDVVSDELIRLLKSGLKIGIATGRGRSVRTALQQSIPKMLWKDVLIGYYNGGQIGTLNDDSLPDGSQTVVESFQPAFDCLLNSDRLLDIAEIEGRKRQITISTKNPAEADECWQLANHLLHSNGKVGVQLVRSSHSFDVLPNQVSKLTIVKQLEGAESNSTILTIGDMGKWPGNDFQLLSHPYSLSVDEVSPDRNSCWNLASPGASGVQATLEYLYRLRCGSRGTARLDLRHLARRKK